MPLQNVADDELDTDAGSGAVETPRPTFVGMRFGFMLILAHRLLLFPSSAAHHTANAMAYIPKLESGEKLIRQFRVKLSRKANPFLFAVSDRALYWPQQKLFTWNDPFYFRRIPHDHIQAVALKKVAPYAFWLLSLIMILAGLGILVSVFASWFELVTGILLHLPDVHDRDLKEDLYFTAIALVAGGIYLSILAKDRFGLRIQTFNKSFTWKPPLFVVDKPSRFRVALALKDMLQTCQQAGLRVFDGHQN
jgi:hypothetical protein